MGRRAVEIEFGRFLFVIALEGDGFRAHADVKALLVPQEIFLSIDGDDPFCADVDDPHFPSLKEIINAQLLRHCQFQALVSRADAACDDPVDVAVDHVDPALFKEPLDQQMLPDGVRVERLHVIRMDGMSNIHGVLLYPSCWGLITPIISTMIFRME